MITEHCGEEGGFGERSEIEGKEWLETALHSSIYPTAKAPRQEWWSPAPPFPNLAPGPALLVLKSPRLTPRV